MNHEMRLHPEPFELIKGGTKTIEMRLYDEKRRQIREGDIITFTNRQTNEEIKTKVINTKLPNFAPAEVESQIDRVLKINAHAITKEEIL